MQAELSIIKAFLNYSTWEQHSGDIGVTDMPEDIQPLYRALDVWHKTQNENGTDLHVLDFASLFFAQNKTNKEFFSKVFDTLETYEPNPDTLKALLVSVKRNKVLRQLSLAAYDVAEGKKSYEEVQKLLEALGSEVEQEDTRDETFVTDDLGVLLDATYKTPGLRWRLNALNRSLGSLRKGDFGFIFARPETGKTTFLASEVTHMAEQLDASRPVLFFVNEEVNEKVKTRVYQAALGITLEELLSNTAHWNKKYKEKFGGKILIPRQSTYSRWDIEKLCKRYNPGLVVVDQLTKVTGFEADRDDLVLGAKFEWARNMAKQYCPWIGVSQADGSGEGKKWLTMQNVANSKTAVQAEADFIVGIGCIHDTGWEDFRFLNISKNKLAGDTDSDPNLRHAKLDVKIRANIARYLDVNV